MNLQELADEVIRGQSPTPVEALGVLQTPDERLYELVTAAGRIRRHFHGTATKVNYLVNLKSGRCPEDCSYCSQRLGSEADILRYTWLSHTDAVAAASAGIGAGARRVCLVASGRGPSNRDVERVGDIITELKQRHPDIEICACLGILKDGQAERLAASGADAYNHNLNTAESHYDNICTTHSFDQRRATVQHAREHGLSACSGLIAGMGETDEQLVEVAFQLRDAGADSVPVNFLMPFDGTPLQGHQQLTPQHCLRILAMVRFVVGGADVRVAAGREQHLRSLQPLALEICNSLFLGDYLTSEGQPGAQDLAMLADGGYTIHGSDAQPSSVLPDVGLRRRGAGTSEPPNA